MLSIQNLLAATPPLAHLNALLNLIAGVLLVVGYLAIKRGDVEQHRKWMLSAFCVSAVFLISYLIHHFMVGSISFTGPALVKKFYIGMLISHIVLAASVVPLAYITIRFGFLATGRSPWGKLLPPEMQDADKMALYRFKHRFLARWTFPIWLYVSGTGVLIYLLLYQIYPPNLD